MRFLYCLVISLSLTINSCTHQLPKIESKTCKIIAVEEASSQNIKYNQGIKVGAGVGAGIGAIAGGFFGVAFSIGACLFTACSSSVINTYIALGALGGGAIGAFTGTIPGSMYDKIHSKNIVMYEYNIECEDNTHYTIQQAEKTPLKVNTLVQANWHKDHITIKPLQQIK
ncbi:hypothetical protein [Rickettsiales endosymbiont of Stachyamoeba lipophora]|uniref:hypothetical protein n=1 Tax=Rickettsiales endosymbiont of Stachyamoeba lipophora TaxID=2486578 RepID=UPI000F64A045|nr:hypothetical protein [Rickettsiales endosymbiont of Stachyamoeba lipophora]AZL16162.1 hypothetical protein EF513_06415 [Rickettsiales endosymbiont of Stachyamoeba lipophora]